ncbi:MAG: DNA polymerase, partial [Thermodesulfobacteriota bacterium]
GGVNRIKNLFGVTEDEARGMRSQFFQQYRNLKKISDFAAMLCKKDRYLEYWTGRRRHFLNPREESHKAFNSLIQGGAFEIVKRAMIRLQKRVPEATMVLQVHDSVVFEINNEVDVTQRIVDEMVNVPEDFGVPFVVEARPWAS